MVNLEELLKNLQEERERTLRELAFLQKLAALDGQIQLLQKLMEMQKKEEQQDG